MGYVQAKIELSNPREPDLQPICTQAMADTGARSPWLMAAR